MKKTVQVAMIVGVMLLVVSLMGCRKSSGETVTTKDTPVVDSQKQTIAAEMFSDRDLESGYDEAASTILTLVDNAIAVHGEGVKVEGNTVTIFQEGTYIVRGALSDGQLIVEADDTDKIQLVLDTVTISNASSSPIYIKQADKVFITLAKDSENKLSVTGEFIAMDENTVDAAIFSKEDVTLNGNGSLTIINEYGNGITSKDVIVITGGTYAIKTSGHGLEGKDSVRISQGEFSIVSDKDGIRSKNKDDASLGQVYIQNGTFTLTAADDGVYGARAVHIDGGSITITTCREGIEGAHVLINGGTFNIYATDDGINATTSSTHEVSIEINGGDITIVMASGDTDAIDSNGDIYINGGTINLTCGSSFDADGEMYHTGGTIVINGETITDLAATLKRDNRP